jgi:hypothetical protein
MMKSLIAPSILERLRVADLPPEEQEEMLSVLGTMLFKSLTLRVLETLSEEKKEEFAILVREGDEEKILLFLTEDVPDFARMVEGELKALGDDLSVVGL